MAIPLLLAFSLVVQPEPVVSARTLVPAYRETLYASVPLDEGRFGVWLTLPPEVARATLKGRLVDENGVPQGESVAEGVASGFYELAFAIVDASPGRYSFEVTAWDGERQLGLATSELTIARPGRAESVLDHAGALRLGGRPFLPIGYAGNANDPSRLPGMGFGLYLPTGGEPFTPESLARAQGSLYGLVPAPAEPAPWIETGAVAAWLLPAPDRGAYQALADADPYRPIALAVECGVWESPEWPEVWGSADVFVLRMAAGEPSSDAASVAGLIAAGGGSDAVWCLLPAGPETPVAETAARVWASLTAGARGVVFESPGERPAELAERLEPLLADLVATGSVWLAPVSAQAVTGSDPRVLVSTRRIGSDRWVAAVNTAGEDLTVRLTGMTSVPGTRIQDWPSGRERAPEADGTFTETLGAHAFRLWAVR